MAVTFTGPSGTSNKPHVKEVAYGWGVEGYIALTPKIDKISFTYDVPSEHFTYITANLAGLTSSPWEKVKLPSTYQYRRKLHHEATGEAVLIEACPKKSISFMRFEFNPAKLGPAGVEFLRDRLAEVFMIEHPWSLIASKCKITRLDLAVDLLGVKVADLLLGNYKPGSAKGKPLKRMFVVSPAGMLETFYYGTRPSKVKVYDKALELVEQQKLPPKYGETPHARIEMRLQPLRSITELVTMDNPFTKLTIHNLKKPVTPPEGPHNWAFFLDCCRIRGIDAALALLPTDDLRDAYRQALEDGELPIWQPITLWKSIPKVLKGSGLLEFQ